MDKTAYPSQLTGVAEDRSVGGETSSVLSCREGVSPLQVGSCGKGCYDSGP